MLKRGRASTYRFFPRLLRRPAAPVILALWLLTAPVAGVDDVDEFITAEMQRARIPGLSLVVAKRGEIIKAQGYGLANRALDTPAAPDTIYKIASVSKQFLATGIMLLAQQARLGVEDPVRTYLDDAPAAWNAITIRHLLTHTAGLVREPPGFDPFKTTSDIELIRTAYNVPLRFTPGERWEYSNTGYNILAEVISRVSGKPWPQFIDDTVFKPSGMTTTWPTNTTARITNRAQGYVDNDSLKDEPRWLALRPGGGFLSSVLDLAKWDAVLYTDKVLTEASRRQMWTPVTLNDGRTYPYGFGWMLGSRNGHRYVQHSGGMPGTRAHISRFLDEDLTIILLMNLDDVDIEPIVAGVAAQYLPKRQPL
jgi:CubicO group peptidase (beta-lactamase class C family)